MAGPHLRLLTKEEAQQPGAVLSTADVETEVLERAIKDMTEWVRDLPDESAWKWSFLRARLRLERRLAAQSPARMPSRQ
jgi:hypothetical protein